MLQHKNEMGFLLPLLPIFNFINLENTIRKIRIGTRGSELALWQAHYLQAQLQAIAIESELVIIKTKGDAIQHLSFDKIEGKGFFTKEIEDALLRGEVDVAVHSMKDLPTTPPDGLVIGAVSYREDPADCLLIRREALDTSLDFKLKKNAVVGLMLAYMTYVEMYLHASINYVVAILMQYF